MHFSILRKPNKFLQKNQEFCSRIEQIIVDRSIFERYTLYIMDKFDDNENNHFNLLREIEKKPSSTQRELAKKMNFSLGKLNYCLKALKSKGYIKLRNFYNNENKLNYIHVLTPKGLTKKLDLTVKFMEKKMREYDDLKKDLEKSKEKN